MVVYVVDPDFGEGLEELGSGCGEAGLGVGDFDFPIELEVAGEGGSPLVSDLNIDGAGFEEGEGAAD